MPDNQQSVLPEWLTKQQSSEHNEAHAKGLFWPDAPTPEPAPVYAQQFHIFPGYSQEDKDARAQANLTKPEFQEYMAQLSPADYAIALPYCGGFTIQGGFVTTVEELRESVEYVKCYMRGVNPEQVAQEKQQQAKQRYKQETTNAIQTARANWKSALQLKKDIQREYDEKCSGAEGYILEMKHYIIEAQKNLAQAQAQKHILVAARNNAISKQDMEIRTLHDKFTALKQGR